VARPLDTSADAYRRQMAAFRAMTPAQRLRIADEMSTEMRTLVVAGVRSRRPGASQDEVEQALDELLLGPALAAAARRAACSADGDFPDRQDAWQANPG
jgi:hypothetical protein